MWESVRRPDQGQSRGMDCMIAKGRNYSREMPIMPQFITSLERRPMNDLQWLTHLQSLQLHFGRFGSVG